VRHTLSAHSKEVTSVAFSPEGSTPASGSGDRTIKLWNPDTGEVFRTSQSIYKQLRPSLSPDGQTLASGSKENHQDLASIS